MNVLHVPWALGPDFINLLGHGAICGTSDTGRHFGVADKDIYSALEKYLFSDFVARALAIGRPSDIWSPREYLERSCFDPQRLDALKRW